MLGGLSRLARDFHASMIEFGDALLQAKRGKLVAVGAKRIGLDDVRARLEVGHVNAENFLGARGIEFIHAALRPQGLVEQRPHRAVRDEHRVAQSLFKLFDFHGLRHTPRLAANLKQRIQYTSSLTSLDIGHRQPMPRQKCYFWRAMNNMKPKTTTGMRASMT